VLRDDAIETLDRAKSANAVVKIAKPHAGFRTE